LSVGEEGARLPEAVLGLEELDRLLVGSRAALERAPAKGDAASIVSEASLKEWEHISACFEAMLEGLNTQLSAIELTEEALGCEPT
jgi:hypothetical protein